MNTVEPIKDRNIVLDIADYLLQSSGVYSERNYILWLTGIYLGLRVSDIIELKVRDVRGKENFYVRQIKTDKETLVVIPEEYKEELIKYIKGKKDYEYLFPSREKKRKVLENGDIIYLDKPLSRQQVYIILKDAAKHFCNARVGTHTMRKTLGYFLYQQTKDIILVKEVLGQRNIEETRRYIGLTQDMKESAVKGISYKGKKANGFGTPIRSN